MGFLEEGFFGSMFDVKNADFKLQSLKRRMHANSGECVGKIRGLGIGGECFDDGVWGG